MWATLLVITVLFLAALYVFLTVHNQTLVVSAGLMVVACLMIVLGISPLLLKLSILFIGLAVEQWFLHRNPAVES